MTLTNRKPMTRTGFNRKPAATSKAPAPRQPMKSRGPKMTPIRKAARGQDCQLRIPGVCNGNPETVVLCHSNRLADGKGMGIKAPDLAGCFGCSSCHATLDGAAPRPAWLSYALLQTAFDAAVVRTHEILRKKGIIE